MLSLYIMEQFFKLQFAILVIGAVFLIAFSFYVETLDRNKDQRKTRYLNIFKTILVVYTIWFVFSGFYFKFFTDLPFR